MSKELAEALNGAHYVDHCEEVCVVFAWFNGPTVKVYSYQGKKIETFSVGDFGGMNVPFLDAVKGIKQKKEEYLQELKEDK